MFTEEKDRDQEVVHITSALKICGCPRWLKEKVKDLVVNLEREKQTDPKALRLFHMSKPYQKAYPA